MAQERSRVVFCVYLLHDALIVFCSSETYLSHLHVLLLPSVVSAGLALANAMVGWSQNMSDQIRVSGACIKVTSKA
jgi:hypothetical protein